MGFMNLFRPKWRHSNPRIRLAAVEEVTDQKLLFRIATTGMDYDVWRAALQKLTDPVLLAEMAMARTGPTHIKREGAVQKLTDQKVLELIAKSDPDERVRLAAVGKITDQAALGDIALIEMPLKEDVRVAAIEKLTDQTLLGRLATADDKREVRRAAARRLEDQALLGRLARKDDDPVVRKIAINRLKDQALLFNIAETDRDQEVRTAAVAAITDQTLLAKIAKNGGLFESTEAIKTLQDEGALADIAVHHYRNELRIAAAKKLADPSALGRVESDIRLKEQAEAKANVERLGVDPSLVLYCTKCRKRVPILDAFYNWNSCDDGWFTSHYFHCKMCGTILGDESGVEFRWTTQL